MPKCAISTVFIGFVTIAASVLMAGCGASGEEMSEATGEGGGSLTVFAASSLTDAFEELGEDFTRQTGAEVTFNFASSSTLAAQIEQGAPADVFASADEAQMENVAEGGLIGGEPEVFAKNRLVVIVPVDNPGDIEDLRDLSNSDLRLVLAQEDVPAAEYAEEVLSNASGDPRYGGSFEDDVMKNIVSREEDVRAAVNRVVVGDADGTFGYASDVTPSIRDEVEVIEISDELRVVAEYPVAVLSGAEDEQLAREWLSLVKSEAGQSTLEEWGFERAAGEAVERAG